MAIHADTSIVSTQPARYNSPTCRPLHPPAQHPAKIRTRARARTHTHTPQKPLDFLHCYHHAIVPLSAWMGFKGWYMPIV